MNPEKPSEVTLCRSPLRVLVLERVSAGRVSPWMHDVSAVLERLSTDHLEMKLTLLRKFGPHSANLERAAELVRSSQIDVIVAADLCRISRDERKLKDFLDLCYELRVRVITECWQHMLCYARSSQSA